MTFLAQSFPFYVLKYFEDGLVFLESLRVTWFGFPGTLSQVPVCQLPGDVLHVPLIHCRSEVEPH